MEDGIAFSFAPPAIPGVGTTGGVTFMLEDRSGGDLAFPGRTCNKFVAAARKRPELTGVRPRSSAGVPQNYVDVDRAKVSGRASTSATCIRLCRLSWADTW